MAATDYAIGIESSNFWFNSGSGFKFYEDSTLRWSMAAGGAMDFTDDVDVVDDHISARASIRDSDSTSYTRVRACHERLLTTQEACLAG